MKDKIHKGDKVIVYRLHKIGTVISGPFSIKNNILRYIACAMLRTKLTKREINGQFVNVSGAICPESWVNRYEF